MKTLFLHVDGDGRLGRPDWRTVEVQFLEDRRTANFDLSQKPVAVRIANRTTAPAAHWNNRGSMRRSSSSREVLAKSRSIDCAGSAAGRRRLSSGIDTCRPRA